MRVWNWFLLRVMLTFAPLPFIAGLAFFVQGSPAGGALLVVISLVMAAAGWRTRGQRQPPP